jgi:hypothetical protein
MELFNLPEFLGTKKIQRMARWLARKARALIGILIKMRHVTIITFQPYSFIIFAG